jgi:hypothetical protein
MGAALSAQGVLRPKRVRDDRNGARAPGGRRDHRAEGNAEHGVQRAGRRPGWRARCSRARGTRRPPPLPSAIGVNMSSCCGCVPTERTPEFSHSRESWPGSGSAMATRESGFASRDSRAKVRGRALGNADRPRAPDAIARPDCRGPQPCAQSARRRRSTRTRRGRFMREVTRFGPRPSGGVMLPMARLGPRPAAVGASGADHHAHVSILVSSGHDALGAPPRQGRVRGRARPRDRARPRSSARRQWPASEW